MAEETVMLVRVSRFCLLLFFIFYNFWCSDHLPDGSSSFCTMNPGNVEASSLQASISPADLHGMWYPTVRRTLVCLSKLYRCIDVSRFYLSLIYSLIS